MFQRYHLIILFLLLTWAWPAMAQHARMGRVGFKLGGCFASYQGKDVYASSSSRGGYCGGGILHLPVSHAFSIQPELLYSQKGASSQSFVLSSSVFATGNQRLAYAEVPVLAKLRSHVGVFLELGPTFSYLLSASAELRTPAIGQNSFDNRSSFKDLELGYAAGAGFQGANGLMLGGRYTRGLTATFKAGAYRGIVGEPSIYNQAFQLYIGFIFFGRTQTTDLFEE